MTGAHGLRKVLTERFDDEVRFFMGWLHRPKAVGSIIPTSSTTARKMASVIDTDSGLPVLELGPGTGVITKAILARGVKPENLFAVEYSPEFVRHLKRHFPSVNVIAGDAFITTDQESAYAVATQKLELHGPPMYYTTDWVAAEESVKQLAALDPELAVTGHGRALAGPELSSALHALAREFRRVAVPEQGRYVEGR